PPPRPAPIMLAAEKRRRLGLDRHLQHVAGESTHETDHRRLGRSDGRIAILKRALDFRFQLNARWYSLHGVDLLPAPRPTEPNLVWQPGGYQRLLLYREFRTSPGSMRLETELQTRCCEACQHIRDQRLKPPMQIPAHRERRFRWKVNADSDRC